MKRTRKDRFIFLRNGVLTFKKRIDGQRSPMQVSLGTTDLALAREKRDEILRQIDAGELDKIRGPRLGQVKIGQVLAAFAGVRALKKITDKYVKQCLANTWSFLRWAHGAELSVAEMEQWSVDRLFSAETFALFRQAYFAEVGDDPEAMKSRERGAASLLRHVHAVFSEDIRQLYKHLALDWRTVDAWLKESSIKAEDRVHATLETAAIREMHAAITPFYESWPDFWLAHMLHKVAGLRNEEICQLRVEWFARAPWGQVFIECRTRPYYEFKGSDGSIPIHSSIVPLLAKFVSGSNGQPKAPTDFVLGTSRPDNWAELVGYSCPKWNTSKLDPREELVDRIHAQWIRRWTPPEKFAKRGYELRRWAAQVMELKHGRDAATSFLRHARGSVAERHYLEEWNKWKHLGNDLGITLQEVQGNSNITMLGDWQQGAAALLPAAEPAPALLCSNV